MIGTARVLHSRDAGGLHEKSCLRHEWRGVDYVGVVVNSVVMASLMKKQLDKI